jgi:anaerobic selenocysteine-containing dehydrogenase
MIPSGGSPVTRFRECTLCEAMCGLAITTLGNRITEIAGDPDDPFSRGHICPKAVALRDVHEDPDRLRYPVRRVGSRWERIAWGEAYTEVAARLRNVQERHGRDAIAVYQGNPTVHNLGSLLFAPPFVRALRTRNCYSATSVDQLPHSFAAFFMFGHQLLLPIPDIDRTNHFLIIGANPVVSNGSLMTAPGVKGRLEQILARGGRIIVIDPRRTETAKLASDHHFIRPGTDALFLLAILHTILTEGLARPARLAEFTDGLDQLHAIVRPFKPERVERATGIGASDIQRIAREFAAAERAVCYARVGGSTQEFGSLVQWLVNALNIVTGNLDRVGGAMFPRPAIDIVDFMARNGQRGHFARWRSRVRGLPEFAGELPVAVLAEEIETEGPNQIRALITSAGNPVLSTPNGTRLDGALARLDFMVSVDPYINETTRHAHIILPPSSPLEVDHYDLVFHALAVRNTAKFSPAIVERRDDTRPDSEIFLELRTRFESRDWRSSTSALVRRWLWRRLSPARQVDLGLRFGPYRLSLAALRRAPHGIDLGPLEPALPKRLYTVTRRIDLAPGIFVGGLAKLLARFDSSIVGAMHRPEGDEFVAIGRRDLRSNNSWMHNSARLVRGKPRCTLLVNAIDADRLGITTGSLVEIESRVGRVVAPATVSDEIMAGVVSLPHGWGHHRPGTQLSIATERPGVSLNDLTDDGVVDPLCGTAAFSATRVRLRPLPGGAPDPLVAKLEARARV